MRDTKLVIGGLVAAAAILLAAIEMHIHDERPVPAWVGIECATLTHERYYLSVNDCLKAARKAGAY